MTAPRICSQCGAIPITSKDLCGRCYQAQRRRERPEVAKPSLLIDRTKYLEEAADRDRTWLEQHRQEALARRRAASRKQREADRLHREQ